MKNRCAYFKLVQTSIYTAIYKVIADWRDMLMENGLACDMVET